MPELGFWVVADGMGGHDNGEVASAIAVQGLCQEIQRGTALEYAIELAHEEILQVNSKRSDSSSAETKTAMGTTIVATKFTDNHYKIAWVGDSRGYLFDGRRLQMLTRDHSLKQQLLDMKALQPEDADNFAHGSTITQALGIEGNGFLRVDTAEGALKQGQVLCLCSDGLTDLVPDDQLEKILAKHMAKGRESDYQAALNALIQAALNAGGKDNVTVQIVGLGPDANSQNKASGSWLNRIKGYFR